MMRTLLLALALPAAAEPLDWASLVRHEQRVTYIGESHRDESFKRALHENLPALQAAGATHLAVEMLGDDVPLRPFSPETLRRALDADWRHNVDWNLALLMRAHEIGLEIVALDMPSSEKSRLILQLAASADMLGPPKEDLPPPWALPSELTAALVRARDRRMAANIERVLRNPETRVLAIVGAFHAHKSFQPAALRDLGHESRSYLADTRPWPRDEILPPDDGFDGRVVIAR